MKIKVKRLTPTAKMPLRAHIDDAGADLFVDEIERDNYGNIVYKTGLAFEIPIGYVGLLFPRSSNAKTDLRLTNCVGVLDSGYRGNVMFKYRPTYERPMPWGMERYSDTDYKVGDRCGQIIVIPIPEVEFMEVEELSESERGTGGYGSTGK